MSSKENQRHLGSRIAIAALAAIAFGAGTSCTSSPPPDRFQNKCEPFKNNRPDPSFDVVYGGANPGFKVIRLTDDGEFTDRCAWTEALEEIKSQPGQLVVVYVHGWKHSDDIGDDNIRDFKTLLHDLRELQVQRNSQAPRRVLGIYIAWRGGVTKLRVIENLSFWNRKKAAHTIAQSAVVTKLLAGIDNIVDQKAQREDTRRDRVIYIGHSFGGLILFHSTLQRLVTAVELAHENAGPNMQYDLIEGTGDLVVLVNPAFESSYFTTLESYQRPFGREFHPAQKPLLLSFSAVNDMATKFAFPLGQAISLNTSKRRRTTLGNYPGFQTHTLSGPLSDIECQGSTGSPRWFDSWCTDTACLVHSNEKKMFGNPFVVAQVDTKDVIEGHNGFWTSEFTDFLASAISKIDEVDVPAIATPALCRTSERRFENLHLRQP